MAFTKFTGTFTNGSPNVTNVTILRGKLSYFANGTRIVVDSDPVKAEIEAIAAPSNTEITLADNWSYDTGVYTCIANMTSEGVRDAVQKIREYIGRVQAEQAALARLYDSTVDGLADTVDGDYFNVIATGDPDVYSQLYLNDDGVAVLQGEMPTSLAIEAAQAAAELSEAAAAASESAAAASATTASTKAGEASTSAAEALASEVAAQAAQAATEQIFDQFGDQYLGAKASDPTVDNDGDPLTEGDIYFNTTDNVLKFYTGTAWVAPEDIATTAAAEALASEQAAAASEAAAATSENNAATSASNAAASATAASNHASSASLSAANALLSESAASTSASNAAGSATAAASSASAAATSETNAANSASDADDSAIAAALSESNAATSATNAASSATASASSATDSANSASASATSASNAATSATNAEDSATAAATSATAAETAENGALASYNSFIEKYYGAYASEPTVDPLGNPMDEGDLYFNTGDNTLYIFNGTNWQRASTTIEGIYDLTEYTNVAGQTTFNVAYDVGLVQVLYNGVQLSEGDFTATDNATVVLDTAVADAADIITIIRWGAVTESSVIVEAAIGGTAVKRTSDGSINAVNVYASGNVGVGTSSPTGKLDVSGSAIIRDTTTTTTRLELAANADVPRIDFVNSGNYTALIGYRGSSATASQNIFEIKTYTSSPMSFQTNNTERMRIDSTGNVGINIDNPVEKLHVSGTFRCNPASGAYADMRMVADNGGDLKWFSSVTGSPIGTIAVDSSSGSNPVMIFRQGNNVERMRIDSSGNVGIGTSSPAGKLTTSVPSNFSVGYNSYSGDGLSIICTATNGSNGGYAGGISFSDINGGSRHAGIAAVQTGSDNNQIGLAFFSKSTSNSTSDLAERMRIDSSGNVLVGLTNNVWGARLALQAPNAGMVINSTSSTSAAIDISMVTNNTTQQALLVYSNSNSSINAVIYSNGNVVNRNNSYGAISDVKLKENIEPATPKLDKLMQVEVVNYNMIGDEQKQIGVTAQQLEQVFPSLIQESDDFEKVQVPQLDEEGEPVLDEEGNPVLIEESQITGTKTKSVKYSVFVPILIKAMQEQQAIIDDLKARIQALEEL